ncbi:hypothetical protein D3C76_1036090 [compost metagenome]
MNNGNKAFVHDSVFKVLLRVTMLLHDLQRNIPAHSGPIFTNIPDNINDLHPFTQSNPVHGYFRSVIIPKYRQQHLTYGSGYQITIMLQFLHRCIMRYFKIRELPFHLTEKWPLIQMRETAEQPSQCWPDKMSFRVIQLIKQIMDLVNCIGRVFRLVYTVINHAAEGINDIYRFPTWTWQPSKGLIKRGRTLLHQLFTPAQNRFIHVPISFMS